MSGPPTNKRPALFVDRDGTIIAERHYLADPDEVELLPGAAAALRAFHDAGWALIVVTNQSGIARGLMTREDFDLVEDRIADVLAAEGVWLDAVYYCPHHPDHDGACECRKPGTLLYRQAIEQHGLDPARSVFTGDRGRDVEPARPLGGRGILVRSGHKFGPEEQGDWEVADDLADVARRVLQLDS